MKHLSVGLQRSNMLQRLYLLNMELDPPAAMHLGALLIHADCCLEELHLCENNLADEGVAMLASAVIKNKSLRLIDLRSNSITEQGALPLQGIITRVTQLHSFHLSDNALGNVGVAALCRGLRQGASALKRLQLSDNGIGSDGGKSVANMLHVNKTLEELDLSRNVVGDDGAAAIASALTRNTNLRSINLRRNDISDRGAQVFAKCFIQMKGLKELVINKNKISGTGGAALLQALQHNTEMFYLTVTEEDHVDRKMVRWFRLNRAGRRIFKQHALPCSLWATVYARISDDNDSLYYFIQSSPEIMQERI